jgi:hypothetical protein
MKKPPSHPSTIRLAEQATFVLDRREMTPERKALIEQFLKHEDTKRAA